jgi:hypothetical protein
MIPTKTKDLVPEVARELNIPEEDLSVMYSFYNKDIKATLSNMDELNVIVKGLGTMVIKGWDIQKQIDKREYKISISRSPENIAELYRQIELFKKVLPKWQEQEKEKKLAGKKKQQYYKNKEAENDSQGKTDTGLEEQE